MNREAQGIGRCSTLLFALCTGVLLQGAVLAQELDNEQQALAPILLPEGPLAELLKQSEQSAAELPGLQTWPSWDISELGGWNSPEQWQPWIDLLRAEKGRSQDSELGSAQRASLALLAKSQGRDAAAWAHLMACGHAGLMAKALPAFLPGRPLDDAPGQTFDGIFRPALPPASNPLESGASAIGNSMQARAVHFKESVFSMEVTLEGDGIQVDLTHVSGPLVEFSVLPPEPPELRIALLYADWTKVGVERQAVPVKLAPGDPTFTIWGRFLGRESGSPIPRSGLLPEPSSTRPPTRVFLSVPSGRTKDSFLMALAHSLGELTGLAVELTSETRSAPSSFPEPLVIRLGSGAALEKKVLELIDRMEHWYLAEANRRLLARK